MIPVKIVLVGESYGSYEGRKNHPLVWRTGRELAKMLSEAKLAPPPRVKYPLEDDMISHWKWLRNSHGIAVTNVFNEHPEGDNTELFFGGTLADASTLDFTQPPIKIQARVLRLKKQHSHHIEKLWNELDSLKPTLIVALGNFACWALLGVTGITEIRGTPKISQRGNYKVIPTFHPAALRQWKLRPDIVADLVKAKHEAQFPEIRRVERWITAENPLTRERITIEEITAWFNQPPPPRYAIDIETAPALFSKLELKKMTSQMKRILSELISMVSFARDPHHAITIPFMTRDDPELNYWKTPEEETTVWEIVASQLQSDVPKTFQNGIFDMSHFLRIQLPTFNADEDDMILHHALYPELRKGLGYLASRYAREISWKQMRTFGESVKRDE